MRRTILSLLGIMVGLDRLADESRGDWLEFARGGQVELAATVDRSTVQVATPTGIRTFPRTAFRTIVPGGRVEDEWRERQAAARRVGTASAWFAAAWWAIEHGLTRAGTDSIRLAMQAPGAVDHAPLSRADRLLGLLGEALDDPAPEPVQALLGGSGWAPLRGRHVVLWHQGSIVAAQERLDLLDQVVTTFYVSLAAQGIELAVPRRRLVSVWFAHQADYQACLRRIDAAPFAETQGYYHPTQGVVFAYDTRSSAEQSRGRLRVERGRLQSGLAATDRVDLERQALLLDLRWRAVDLGIAAHETIHQLVAASGLAPRGDSWPNWLHEGFAAQFEVVRGGRWAGFGGTNDLRIADWRSVAASSQIAPLLRDDGLTHGYHQSRYAESWALVNFLRQTRPEAFVTFLEILRTPRPENQPNTSSRAFQAAFETDLGKLGDEWRAFFRDRRTPMEAHTGSHRVAKSF